MATGTAPVKRKSNRQFQVLLVVWLMMFGLGVLAGVALTKRAFGMPAWVQRIVGLEPINRGDSEQTDTPNSSNANCNDTGDTFRTCWRQTLGESSECSADAPY